MALSASRKVFICLFIASILSLWASAFKNLGDHNIGGLVFELIILGLVISCVVGGIYFDSEFFVKLGGLCTAICGLCGCLGFGLGVWILVVATSEPDNFFFNSSIVPEHWFLLVNTFFTSIFFLLTAFFST